MPTYAQLMSCAPPAYQAAGRALDAYAARVSTAEQGFRAQVGTATNPSAWQGRARGAADRSAQRVGTSLERLADQIRQAARALEQAGQEIAAAQTELRTLSAEIRAQGWVIAPIGVVWLGQPQVDMVTAAGPGAPAVFAALAAAATAMTSEIFAIVGAASVADVTGAEWLLQISAALGGPGVLALNPHLNEHLFDGHRRPNRITGYHARPGGVDAGANGFTINPGSIVGPDANGLYSGRVHGLALNGNPKQKFSTFFPDHWTPDQVSQAVRGAFYNRQPVMRLNTATGNHEWDNSRWRGTYNGMTIEGFLTPGSTWATAGPGEIASAFPVM